MRETCVNVIQAERKWLEDCAHVSETTLASYAGEVRRFREYLGRGGVNFVQEVTEADWVAYLTNLTQNRSTIASKRIDALKPSSAMQAARITRAFLRHCWMQRWLKWIPSVGRQRCPAVQPQAEFRAPDGLVSFLLDPGESDDEALSRMRCTVGLAFWGGFRPKEIAELRVWDLVLAADGSALLHPPGRYHGVALPGIMVEQLRRYTELRVLRVGPLMTEAALIGQLTSAGPITAAAAWQVLKDWTVEYAPPDGEPVSTRAIRETFKQLAGAEAVGYLQAVEHQAAGRLRPSRVLQGETINAAQVAADLLEKMASGEATP